jgi:Transposase
MRMKSPRDWRRVIFLKNDPAAAQSRVDSILHPSFSSRRAVNYSGHPHSLVRIKALPGRKTDVKDAEWIADLLQHGLVRPSFIPPAPQRELRELTRYRSSLVADRARTINRLQKVLEVTNLKLASVITDVTGVTARAILRAFLSGEETDPWELANLARGSLRGKQIQLAQGMVGTVKDSAPPLRWHRVEDHSKPEPHDTA